MKKLLLAGFFLGLLANHARPQEAPFIVQKSDLMTLKQPPVAGGGGGGAASFDAITSGTNTTATMTCDTGCTVNASGSGTITATAVPVGGISGLGAGVATWLATATSANLRSALSDETGSGVAVFNDTPTMIAPNFANGTVEAGSFTLSEDGDNGSNTIRVRGQDSLLGSRVFRLNDPGPPISGTAPTVLIGAMSGVDQIYLFDDFMCGKGAAAGEGGGCLAWNYTQTNSSWASTGTSFDGGLDASSPPGLTGCLLNSATDTCNMRATGINTMLLMPDFRFRARVKMPTLSVDADRYSFYIGADDATNGTAAPANGVYFVYADDTDHSGGTDPTYNAAWQFSVRDDAGENNFVCTGATVTTNWVKLEIWYESGTGVHFYVDESECANSPVNTQLPTSAGEQFSPVNVLMFMDASTTASRFPLIDYVAVGPTPISGR